MSKRPFDHVGVLMGGPSSEREVSLRSGAAVAGGLRKAGYRVDEIDVRGHRLEIPAGVECVFVALHGEYGEDGQVQAELEALGIPYTGSGPEASRRSFDKIASKEVFVANGIPTPDYEVVKRGAACTLAYPVVVKPSRQGSTIGVHRVDSDAGWRSAVEDALSYDDNVLAETYIPGRELTIGVVGSEALPVVEIRAPGEWYDYQSKYTRGACEYLVPAPLDAACEAECRRLALAVFTALGCRGLGRVDIRAAPDGRLYVLELNNVPGFTETSLLPKAAAEAGVAFPDLCDRIIRMATLESMVGSR